MSYKKIILLFVILFSFGFVFARDFYILKLPNSAIKIGDKQYQLSKDFDTSIKQIKRKFYGNSFIRSDILVNEKDFRIYVFYNLKPASKWRKLFVIEEKGKVRARFF